MFSTEDTIVAVATPPGRGGIGVIRISGPRAADVAQSLIVSRSALVARHATLTLVRSGMTRLPDSRTALDQVIATFFPGPASYTGEDVVEISAHGSPVVLKTIVENAVTAGARPAAAGEFTLRAFLNGRIDLPQAEAVADLIDAATPLQARAAFDQLQGTLTKAIGEIDASLFDLIARLEASVDFPDEGYHFIEPDAIAGALDDLISRMERMAVGGRRGRLIREGRVVAIVGAPNAGKSSLFNAIVGSARAIVTPVPGTTRDLVTEIVDLNGLCVTLVDTAGLRETSDQVELEGVARSWEAIRIADAIVVVHDGSATPGSPPGLELGPSEKIVAVANKCDVPSFVATPGTQPVSALTGSGIEQAKSLIAAALGQTESGECPEMTNIRHLALLDSASQSLRTARLAVAGEKALSEEFVLADLQQARIALEEISGHRSSEDVLIHIFERFCIGK